MNTAPSWIWPAHHAAPVVAVPAPVTLPVSRFSRLVTVLFYLLGIGTGIAFVLVAHHSLQQPTGPGMPAAPSITEPAAAQVSVTGLKPAANRAASSIDLAGKPVEPRVSTAAKPAPTHAVGARRSGGEAQVPVVNTLIRSGR